MFRILAISKTWGLIGLLCLGMGAITQAQTSSGAINGVINDKLTGQLISGATIKLHPSNQFATTKENGEFNFSPLPFGVYQLSIAHMGYETIFIDEIQIQKDTLCHFAISLLPSTQQLQEVQVNVVRSRGSEIGILAEQQRSFQIQQKIGAQELSRKGLGDAAAAVSKISGVSNASDLRQLFVRGLGDRYNTTSYNGLPLPSNDPELKNIALDLFDTSIIEFINVDKTYQTSFAGDFGGAHIGIQAKELNQKQFFEISLSSNLNSQAIKYAQSFQIYSGGNMLGFSKYELPKDPFSKFNFAHSMNPSRNLDVLPIAFKVLGGRKFNLAGQGSLNLMGALKFDNAYQHYYGFQRAINAQEAKLLDLNQTDFGYVAQTTGLLNLQYVHPNKHEVSYHFLLVNNSKQQKDTYAGFIRDIAEDNNGLIQRGTHTQTQLFLHQLKGKIHIKENFDLQWGGSFSQVNNYMPDRIQNTFRYHNHADQYTLVQNTITDNHRYNQSLVENEYALRLLASHTLSEWNGWESQIQVGFQGGYKFRDFAAIQYNLRINGNYLTTPLVPHQVDDFFNQENFNQGKFQVESFAGGTPQSYGGEQFINAGFLNWRGNYHSKWFLDVGIRYENLVQHVDWRTQLDPAYKKNQLAKQALLPSLSANYKINDKQNFRIAMSKTYTLPQFKERALFVYEDIPDKKRGNPDLYPSDNYNLDLKWELFPKSTELISIGFFGKYIQNPINETTIASSSNDISYVNTGDYGTAVGLEWEIRKELYRFAAASNKLSLGVNGALMRTNQRLDAEKVAKETNLLLNLTNTESRFTGASDLLINADLTYQSQDFLNRDLMVALIYSYTSDYIYSLGVEGRGNLVNKGIGTVDAVMKFNLFRNVVLDLGLKNITNPTYKRVQQQGGKDIPVMQFNKGRFYSIGITIKK